MNNNDLSASNFNYVRDKIYSNVNGSLANLAHLKNNLLGQLELRAAIESIRAREQQVASTLQLGILAICLTPVIKIFRGVTIVIFLGHKIIKNLKHLPERPLSGTVVQRFDSQK
jgi:hypothetical protein